MSQSETRVCGYVFADVSGSDQVSRCGRARLLVEVGRAQADMSLVAGAVTYRASVVLPKGLRYAYRKTQVQHVMSRAMGACVQCLSDMYYLPRSLEVGPMPLDPALSVHFDGEVYTFEALRDHKGCRFHLILESGTLADLYSVLLAEIDRLVEIGRMTRPKVGP